MKFGIVIGSLLISGCAIHYYDKESGAEHIYGFGHMVMKAKSPDNTHQAIVRGTDIWGLGLGYNDDGGYFSLGWDSVRRIEIIDENTTVDLIWPNSNFLNTRIGSSFPGTTLKQSNTEEGSQ
ncbi:MAG: hypothetical protein WC782_10130 [Methylococcaceae bacterium]